VGEAVDRPVIWGEAHRYQIGVPLGERTFWALDEAGRPWAVEIGRTEILQARAELARRLPQRVLPPVRECGEMPGGRLSYLVSQWLPGYSLGTFLEEGRRLAPRELRKLGHDLGLSVEALARAGVELTSVESHDIVYAVRERCWRLIAPGRWRSRDGAVLDLGWLAAAMLAAGGSVPGERPPWAEQDRRLWQLLEETLHGPLQPRHWSRRVFRLKDLARGVAGFVRR